VYPPLPTDWIPFQKTLQRAISSVEHNDLPTLRSLVNGHLIQAKDERGHSVIVAAAMNHRREILIWLMQQYGGYVDEQLLQYGMSSEEVRRLRRASNQGPPLVAAVQRR